MSTLAIVRDHMQAGHRGTCEEIAKQLGIERQYAYRFLRSLCDEGAVECLPSKRVPGKPGATPSIYVATSVLLAERAGQTIVEKALASMPALQQAWMSQPNAPRQSEGGRADA